MEIVYIENVTLASQIGMIIPNSRYLPAILEATTSIQKLIRWSGEFAQWKISSTEILYTFVA